MNTNNTVKLDGINIGISITTKSQTGGVVLYSDDVHREKILNKDGTLRLIKTRARINKNVV